MQNKKPISDWKSIKGERIRRQYVNFTLVLILLVGFIMLFINIIFAITGKPILTGMMDGVMVLLKYVLAWAVLLLLNIFCIGKTVCILTSDGLYCESGFYKWEHIQRMEFHLPGASKSKITYASVRLIGKDMDVTLLHAPVYLMIRVRKYSPKITVSLRKADRLGMLCVGLVVCIIVWSAPVRSRAWV